MNYDGTHVYQVTRLIMFKTQQWRVSEPKKIHTIRFKLDTKLLQSPLVPLELII